MLKQPLGGPEKRMRMKLRNSWKEYIDYEVVSLSKIEATAEGFVVNRNNIKGPVPGIKRLFIWTNSRLKICSKLLEYEDPRRSK